MKLYFFMRQQPIFLKTIFSFKLLRINNACRRDYLGCLLIQTLLHSTLAVVGRLRHYFYIFLKIYMLIQLYKKFQKIKKPVLQHLSLYFHLFRQQGVKQWDFCNCSCKAYCIHSKVIFPYVHYLILILHIFTTCRSISMGVILGASTVPFHCKSVYQINRVLYPTVLVKHLRKHPANFLKFI